MPIEINDEENNGYASDDDEHRYDDDDDSEDQVDDFGGEDQYDSSSSQKPESNDEFDLSEAAHVRQEYDESSSKLSEIQSRISSLKQKLKQDFGPDKEFYSLYGQCFESKQNKYVYKVCPFKEATQVEGYSTTRLGYLALLSTPALCLDSKLKELQDKLESLNKDRPQAPRT